MLAERRTQSHRPRQFEFEFQAIERERRRVAKELHDEILPSLARLIRSIQSENLEQRHEQLIQELHNMVAAFRDVLGELHPVDLEELGFVPALNNICTRYARLTSRSIFFTEKTEDCPLSEYQQLCLYRAMQAVLRMFAASANDVLMVTYSQEGDQVLIALRCIDKVVASNDWLAAGNPEFDLFEYLCGMAGAKCAIGIVPDGDHFPFDLVIKARPNKEIVPSHYRPRNAELFEGLALQAERRRLAQDINNMILPHLDKCNALADASENVLLSMAVHDRMQLVSGEVKAVMGEAHPQLLEQAGLVPSIMTLVDRFTRASLIETTIAADLSSADVGINSDAKFAIYRATQEALNNVEKHSGASLARIAVRRDPQALIVEIEDNGKGFEQQASVQSRGLKIIRERAEAIGAEVSWQKAVTFETGTLVCISLPYNGRS